MSRLLIATFSLLLTLFGCSKETHFGGGRTQVYLIVEDSTRATDVSWNPNGSKLAYSTGKEIKYVTPPSTEGIVVAETQGCILTTPSWSPTDPARIAYAKIDSAITRATIIESDTLGQDIDTIFSYTSGQLGVGFVSPESLCLDLVRPQGGTRLYVGAVGNRPGTWVIDTVGGTISFLLEGRWPDVDPSEHYLAYAASAGGIRVRNLDSLTTDSVSSSGLYPSWSPDGEQVAYSCGDTVYTWSRTTGQIRMIKTVIGASNLSWRNPPHLYDIAVRMEIDGTVWLVNTLLPGSPSQSNHEIPQDHHRLPITASQGSQ